MEIERKFVLRSFLPQFRKMVHTHRSMEQWYLDGFRIRKIGADCFITVKKGSGLVRQEWEEKIPRWVFDVLKKMDTRGVVSKTRYFIPFKKHMLEVDVYRGPLIPLITLECEFKSVADARAFQVPAVTGEYKEVTGKKEFKNRSLAKNGLPSAVRDYYRK
jgi:CYTH domain-containing protein